MLFIRHLVLILVLLCASTSAPIYASDTITIGTVETLSSIDPAETNDVFSWSVLTHLYTGLTRQIPDSLRYELALATSHTISTDGLEHTFSIRPDTAFNDGTSITAQTFANSINHAIKLGNIAVKPYIKSAAVGEDNTLLLTLHNPIPYTEQLLALPPYFPKHPSDTLITNGVYKFASFDPGQSIILERDLAWKGTPASTQNITIRHYDTPADLRHALSSHEIDIAWRGLPPDEIEIAKRTNGINVIIAPGLQTFYLLFNPSKPFDKIAARQATAYLIDREYIAQTSLNGSVLSLYSLIPPELFTNAPSFPKVDPVQAKSILQAGGFSKFNTINADLQTSTPVYGDLSRRGVDQIAAYLRKTEAYQVTVRDTEPIAFYDQIERGTFSLALIGWTPLVPHPDAYLRPILHSQGQFAASVQYKNTAIDHMLDQAALNSDPTSQRTQYKQAMSLGVQDIFIIPLWQQQQQVLAWDSVSGITIAPNYLLRLETLVNP